MDIRDLHFIYHIYVYKLTVRFFLSLSSFGEKQNGGGIHSVYKFSTFWLKTELHEFILINWHITYIHIMYNVVYFFYIIWVK